LNDPQTAPEGKTGVIVSLLLDYALVKRVQDDGWHEEFVAYMEKKQQMFWSNQFILS
jgi:hypothetical protein